MSKTLSIVLGTGAILLLVAGVVGTKRISPLRWGWYGDIQRTDDLAIRGYAPVAYFAGSATLGQAAFSSRWHGATWRFASAENKTAFEAAPETYAPQFGGFCAYASSKGFTATIDPTAFRVEDGKLYLFNDAGMRDKWIKELPAGVIEKARRNWEGRPAKPRE